MRLVVVLVCVLATSSLALFAVVPRTTLDAATSSARNPHFSTTDVLTTRDAELLAEFRATLNKDIILECVTQYEANREMDLDFLATCGDFDLYARYLRVSKFDAVKKFQHVIIYSSSMLEFDDRLAR